MAERKRQIKIGCGGVAAALLLYLIAWPVSIDPVAWEPPAAPTLEPNDKLRAAELIDTTGGPEDVAVDKEGRIYAASEIGHIVRISGDKRETFADTEGRPLGLAWGKDGALIVADADRGLLSIDASGTIDVLTTTDGERPFKFTDDVDVASDGKIYFSDASHKFGYGEHVEDLMEGRGNGRLLVYDPAMKTTTTLLRDLCFANGVALADDDSYVLVNETGRYRITRYWLVGDKRGHHDVFADNLPGFPDGVSRSPRGTFWVAMFTVRNPMADRIAPSPFVKKLVMRLPSWLRPKPKRYGLVLELDHTGKIVRTLQDPDGERVHAITSLEEVAGVLYLGTLHDPVIGRLAL